MTELKILGSGTAFDPKEDGAFATAKATDWLNKQRTLVAFSQGIRANERQLAVELSRLMCHSKTDSAVAREDFAEQLAEMCRLRNCQNCLFFEQKKHEAYLWVSKSAEGPSVKFRLSDIVLAESTKFHGNCLKASRPVLSFDAGFLASPELALVRHLLVDCFNTPKNHPKAQPFFDKVFHFGAEGGVVDFRHFQMVANGHRPSEFEFVEVGPRFRLELVKAFDSFCGGRLLFANPLFRKAKDLKVDRQRETDRKTKSKIKKRGRKEKRAVAALLACALSWASSRPTTADSGLYNSLLCHRFA